MLNIFTNFDPYILYIYTFWSLHIIFESLPISSSGHLKLLAQLFSKFTKTSFTKISFNNLNFNLESKNYIQYIMHIPNFFIILLFLAVHNINLFLDLRLILKLFIFVFVANLFTGFFYFLFKFTKLKALKKLPLYLGFSITALLLLSSNIKYFNIKYFNIKALDFDNISLYWTIITAITIGTVQGISLLPGISRLTSTFTAGIWLNFTPITALTLSLSVQAPLILAALLKESKNIISNNYSDIIWLKFLKYPKFLSIILFASFTSYKLILLILFMLQKNLIWIFGIYMLIPILFSYYYYN